MGDFYLLNDSPSTSDLLSFNRYISPLAEIMAHPDSNTPFTIGIFGPWGSGKSTLLEYLESTLKQQEEPEFYCVSFNPWIYRDEKNLVVPLIHTIEDTLLKSTKNKIKESARKIGTVLARLGAALVLKTITVNQVSLKDIEEQEQAYMQQYQRARSAIRTLKKDLQEVIDEITEGGKSGRLVIFIDDLDRCEPDQIISLLESVKLFLDLRHCFFIFAIDDEVIYRAIQIKYDKFEFYKDRKEQIGQEYLEKMIQLPLYLYPLSGTEVEDYLTNLNAPKSVTQQAKVFAEIMLPNPRKIKRIINLFLLNLAIIEGNKMLKDQIKTETLARLIVIQVQEYGLYVSMLKNSELSEYLSKVYCASIKIKDEADWVKLEDRSKLIRDLCMKYYRPASWIESIFKIEDAFPQAAQLIPYFNMLGRGERQ